MIKHILVTGISGSGKSTYSRRLSKAIDLPIIELDVFDQAWRTTDYTKGAREGVKKALKTTTRSIIVGQGIMRMNPEEIKDHELHVIHPSEDVIIQRRLQRSIRKYGSNKNEVEYIQKAKWLIEQDRDNLNALINGHPQVFLIT